MILKILILCDICIVTMFNIMFSSVVDALNPCMVRMCNTFCICICICICTCIIRIEMMFKQVVVISFDHLFYHQILGEGFELEFDVFEQSIPISSSFRWKEMLICTLMLV